MNGTLAGRELREILLAQHLPGFIVEERQERISTTLGDSGRLMLQRTAEYHGAACGRSVRPGAEFWEAQVAALESVRVQVDRHGKAAMCRTVRFIVAMRLEKPTLCGVVAGHQIALYARGLELVGPGDHRDQRSR